MAIDQQTAYARSAQERQGPRKTTAEPRRGADSVCFWREKRFDDLECLKARFYRHAYAPHVHDTFALGVIVAGAEAFTYRGARHVAPAGSLVAVNPDELHDGAPAGEGFAYRMLYPSVALVQDIADELDDRPAGFPAFRAAVMDDPEAAARLGEAHALMEAHVLRGAPKLAVDEAFTTALTLMVRRHSVSEPRGRRLGQEPGPIRRARRFIDDLYMQDLTLDGLARIAGLSRYHFLRAFRREVGVTPHAYLTHRRIAAAKLFLAGAEPLSEVALACGFYDQSHFSRAFKGCTGLTPGQYRRGSRAAA
ncbi:AraC family transcriptional regulator [Pelagibius marinus]|uniref:AraC family transcriptional regulator n=1 Tax=Pelagibius marinus TaxID=2762760 RepID=UPI00187241B8|nr:AraC family transcriptional regulator [Pelagibius marinus]